MCGVFLLTLVAVWCDQFMLWYNLSTCVDIDVIFWLCLGHTHYYGTYCLLHNNCPLSTTESTPWQVDRYLTDHSSISIPTYYQMLEKLERARSMSLAQISGHLPWSWQLKNGQLGRHWNCISLQEALDLQIKQQKLVGETAPSGGRTCYSQAKFGLSVFIPHGFKQNS